MTSSFSAIRRVVRAAIRIGRPGARPATEPRATADRFAAFRDPSGPTLVSGPTPRHVVSLDERPSVVVLVPHLAVDRMSGGPNTIFNVTMPLARDGLPLRYVATSGPLDADVYRLRAHAKAVTGIDADAVEFVDASAPGGSLDIGVGDVLVATWWPTAHTARAALDVTVARGFVYLIQDFEPGFYPWSTKYALAAATYDMPFRAVVNEPMLLAHLRATGTGRFADPSTPAVAFMPAVDRGVFAPRTERAYGPRRLVFYARPRHARNLFELGLAALRRAAEVGVFDSDDWEFLAIGEPIADLAIGRGTLRATPWLDYRAYAAFLRSADVLLSLMLSPHTSYPPLEMAATGGHVVTNTFGGKTAEALRAISPTIHPAAPAVEPLVEALREAVAAAHDPAPDASVELASTWDAALRDVTPWVRRAVDELRAGV